VGNEQKRGTFANRFLLGFFMNETWIGPGCLPPPPPPGGWVDMEVEVLRDVPGFIEVDGGGKGTLVGDRPRSNGLRNTAADWTPPFVCSNDPFTYPNDGYRRRTKDRTLSLFRLSAGPARVSASPLITTQYGCGRSRGRIQRWITGEPRRSTNEAVRRINTISAHPQSPRLGSPVTISRFSLGCGRSEPLG